MRRISVIVGASVAITIAVVIDRSESDPKTRTAQIVVSTPRYPPRESFLAQDLQTASAIEKPARLKPPRASDAPVELDGLPVRAFVDRWSHAARTGDPRAAYRVYQAEAFCARADENERSLRGPLTATSDEMRGSIATRTRTLRELCVAVSPAEVDERLHFLLLAARSGNANAQVDFYIEGPYGKPYDLQADDPDPNVIAWKNQAIDFLTQAAMQNNRDALEFLGVAYFNGIVAPQNLEASLAYDIALARANHTDPDLSLLATQLIKQLPESSVSRARTAGEAFFRQCCSDQAS